MMDMHSRNEYLKVLRERYLKASIRKEKSRILDEYCSNTGQARKYVIRKIQPGVELEPRQRKKRQETCDGEIKAGMAFLHSLSLPENYKIALGGYLCVLETVRREIRSASKRVQ